MTEAAHIAEREVPVFDIGDRMRKAREHAGLSQGELARDIGIGRTSIVTYESGRQRPTRPVTLAWGLRTGVPYEWLCHGDTQPCVSRPDGTSSQVSGLANKMHCSQTCTAA